MKQPHWQLNNQAYIHVLCKHCKFQECEDSMPRESFKVNQGEVDKDGNPTEKIIVKEVKEINIVRGQKFNDIIGWTF